MKKIKILKPVRDKKTDERLKTGDVVERSNARTDDFVSAGFAEVVETEIEKKSTKSKSSKTKEATGE